MATAVTDHEAARAGLPPDVIALYEEVFEATRTGPLFNAFSYPTKISAEAVALFIATHTAPGDSILDMFAGSGSTGLAVKLCDCPTPRMLSLADELGIDPTWGPRHGILYEVGRIGSLIARVMCNPPDPDRFRRAGQELVEQAEISHGWMYRTRDPDGAASRVRHVIWSEVLKCPGCGFETTYWEAAVRREPLELAAEFTCTGCRRSVAIRDCVRKLESVRDPLLNRLIERRVRVPVWLAGRSGPKRWARPVTPQDLATASDATAAIPTSAPVQRLEWGDLQRSGYHTGVSHLHHFYTPRNFAAVARLWELIDEFDDDLHDALRLLVLSFNASHSTLMTRIVVKRDQRDFVLTGAQSGVLYISALPVEKNVFDGLGRKISTLHAAFSLVRPSTSTVDVRNESSTRLGEEDGSIAYVFTDPPFGDYIPYAELNQINELWLGEPTDRSDEIIISKAQGKDADSYEALMKSVFREVDRVLAPGGLITVVFHSAHARVWRALTNAYAHAGFGVLLTSLLNKVQASFKQVVSTTSVRGDPLILLDRSSHRPDLHSLTEVVEDVLASASEGPPDELTRERLYSRFVTRCLLAGVPVEIGAAEFYDRTQL